MKCSTLRARCFVGSENLSEQELPIQEKHPSFFHLCVPLICWVLLHCEPRNRCSLHNYFSSGRKNAECRPWLICSVSIPLLILIRESRDMGEPVWFEAWALIPQQRPPRMLNGSSGRCFISCRFKDYSLDPPPFIKKWHFCLPFSFITNPICKVPAHIIKVNHSLFSRSVCQVTPAPCQSTTGWRARCSTCSPNCWNSGIRTGRETWRRRGR